MSSLELTLLFVLAVGMGGCGLGLLGLLAAPRRLWTVAALVLAGLLAGAAAAAVSLDLDRRLCWALAGMSGVAGAFVLCRWQAILGALAWLGRGLQDSRLQGGVLVCLSVAFVLGGGLNLEQQITLMEDDDFLLGMEIDPSRLQEVDTVHAVTDRGHPVVLCKLPDEGLTPEEFRRLEMDTVKNRDLAQKQIRTAPPSEEYNCHGWVFAAGQFWVRGREVPAILEDNGYQPVSTPREGDVIVYRDGNGDISHTGLVRAADDGLVLIESKWGWLGRYVHKPLDTSYGDRWTFYHSERSSHRLGGLGGETPLPILAAD